MSNPRQRSLPLLLQPSSFAALVLGIGLAWPAGRSNPAATPPARPPTERERAESKAAFLAAYRVFLHPRCMNCHPDGEVPLQGEDSHPHSQNIHRGPEGKGWYALKCSNCHQDAHLPGENMPPGNPNWHLPPPSMRMVFQGRTPRQLALQLQNPDENGRKTLEEIVRHVSEDSLVLGCWNPGEGRTKPPLSHAEFVRKMREWVEKGAASPD